MTNFFVQDKEDRGGGLDSNLSCQFVKLNASGNDFVVLVDLDDKLCLSSNAVVRLCDRNFGIGCDQLIVITDISEGAVSEGIMTVRIYNQDGSVAANCGNGIRAIVGHFFACNPTYQSCCVGILGSGSRCQRNINCSRLANGLCSVGIGDAMVKSEDGDCFIDVGNLHKIRLVDVNLDSAIPYPVPDSVLPDDDFNLNYVSIIGSKRIGLTTIERGVGFTKCCGSGSCASVVYGVFKGLLKENELVDVITEGSVDSGDLCVKAIRRHRLCYDVLLIGGYDLNFYGVLPKGIL